MPVKRRRAKQRRAEVDAKIREYFEDKIDHTFFFDNFELSNAWNQIGHEVVEDWILTRPGTRPRMWWRLSAPLDHRTTDGGGGPSRAPECLDIPVEPPAPAKQTAFLRRHALFLPGEAKRLPT